MSLKLRITKPGDTSYDNEVIPNSDSITLGRRGDNDVVLDDGEKQVSGCHARIDYKGGTYFVTDLGSTNHTLVDDRQIEPNHPVPIRNGTTLQIGLLQVEVILDQSSSDLGKTLVRKDPGRSATLLGDRLCEVYADHRESSADTRTRALREVIAGVLGDSDPEQARSVLAIVRQRFGGSGGSGGSRGDGGASAAALGTQEALYRAGHTSVREMSQHFLGDASFASAEDVGRFARLIQQALDVMLDWVSRALKGRAEFKDEFGAELTMMFFPKQQNPLKSGGGPEELGKFLLDWSQQTNLGSVRTLLEEALNDLSMHQISLLRAVQKTLRQVFDQLDPEKLEAEARQKDVGLLQKLVGGESPWEIYKQAFVQMRDEKSKFFDGVIFPTMQAAYIKAHQELLDAPKRDEITEEKERMNG